MRHFFVLLCIFTPGRHVAAAEPRALDDRVQVSLFAEQPLIATPTGIDVDARGRVWAVECNTHFRPTDYPGHPSDRILVFSDRDGDGRAETPVMFADGFTATMSVAVRPVWLPPVTFGEVATSGKARDSSESRTQVFIATRNEVILLEDRDGDDVCDEQTVLWKLETNGNYPHNGFAGFAFASDGYMFVGMGENLGEPYRILDRAGKSVFESRDGGNLFRFRPDGTDLKLWAKGFWNPHASCFDAFGRMFSVDNDPDSRPPCRLLHVIEGGDYGYRFSNGRKGLHPFTSWNGEIAGTLPMVAGTGEAPSEVLAYEHEGLPEEYRGDLLVTSWGDHRIDRFRLTPKGASFESVAEPFVVGGEDFRPVGLATGPDGSLYCTDWVRRDYELHGQGRIWRIGMSPPSPTLASHTTLMPGADLAGAVRSASLPVRRAAARELAGSGPDALLAIVRSPELPLRARYEALDALTLVRKTPDHTRVLKTVVPVREPPFDPLQTLMATAFDDGPAVTQVEALLENSQGSDPMYLLHGIESFQPVFRSLASGSPKVIEAANACVATTDPFARSRSVLMLAEALSIEQLTALIKSQAALSEELRRDLVLAARAAAPRDLSPVLAALERSETGVRRAAVQWAAEEHLAGARAAVQASLSRPPMTSDLFLATMAGLEMLDGRDPQDFDRTPANKYVVPLAADPATPPAVLAAALRLVDPNDAAMTVDLLKGLAESDDPQVRAEAVRTVGFSSDPRAIDALIAIADRPDLRSEAALGLARWVRGADTDPRVRAFFLDQDPWTVEVLRAIRGLVPGDPELRAELLRRAPGLLQNQDASELAAQLEVALAEPLPDPLRGGAAGRPADAAAWREATGPSATGDASEGRIVFFHPQGPGCFRCHTVEGRGGRVGPDLSGIGQTTTYERLVQSILDPGKEVAPQFTNWQMVTDDGIVHTGMIVHENEGVTVLGDQEGRTTELKTSEVVERRPQKTSVMPEKLWERMTVREFRDLLEFLKSPGR